MTASQESILIQYLARVGAMSSTSAITEYVGWSEVTPEPERRQTLAEAWAYQLGLTDGRNERPTIEGMYEPIH